MHLLICQSVAFRKFDGISGSERHKYNAEQKKVRGSLLEFSLYFICSQKLIAVNELRLVVYIYSVAGCCASMSLQGHKRCHKRN